MNRLLFILDPEKPLNRIIRRGVVVGFLTLLAVILQQVIEGQAGFVVPDIYVPILVALLAALDKCRRV